MNNGLLNKCKIHRTAKYSYDSYEANMATPRDDDGDDAKMKTIVDDEYGESNIICLWYVNDSPSETTN